MPSSIVRRARTHARTHYSSALGELLLFLQLNVWEETNEPPGHMAWKQASRRSRYTVQRQTHTIEIVGAERA